MRHVVVGIIYRNRNKSKQYLLVSSVLDLGKYTGFYYPPGGHFKKEEVEKSALIRKIKEELGIVVTPLKKITETPGDVTNQITHWWHCNAEVNKINIDTEKLDSIKWLTRKEILNHQKVWPATKEFFEEHISD